MYPEVYRNLLHNLCDGIAFIDTNRNVTYWNKGAESITGIKSPVITGGPCGSLVKHVDDDGVCLCENNCPALETLADGKRREFKTYMTHSEGHMVPVIMCVSPIFGPEGRIEGVVEMFSDFSWKYAALERITELQRLSLLDPMTEIGNRRHGEISITTKLGELKRYGHAFGILFIDIDRFKEINDTMGHDMGDRAIRMVAKTLAASLRPFDLVSRWGGEEFVVILVNPGGQAQINVIAERVRSLVEMTHIHQPDSTPVKVTVSIGATIAVADDTMHSLIERADRLNYQSKDLGRNCVSVG